jgi:hypothetical protein
VWLDEADGMARWDAMLWEVLMVVWVVAEESMEVVSMVVAVL